MLIVVSGLPGTGKSTLADGIGRARGAPVYSVDPIESAILRSGIPRSFETGLAAYLVAEAGADAALASGLDAIVDAVSSVPEARAMWRDLAARHATPVRVVVCEVAPDVAAARLAARDRGLALPEPTRADLDARATEWTPWPDAHLVVSTEWPPSHGLSSALAWLDADP